MKNVSQLKFQNELSESSMLSADILAATAMFPLYLRVQRSSHGDVICGKSMRTKDDLKLPFQNIRPT